MTLAFPCTLWAVFIAIFALNLVSASHSDSLRRSSGHRRHHLGRAHAHARDSNATSLAISYRSLVERAPPSGWNLFIKSGNDGGGCYVDSSAARILTGYSGNDANNGLQSCLNTCQSKGFTYGGVQYSTQCYVSPHHVQSEGQSA